MVLMEIELNDDDLVDRIGPGKDDSVAEAELFRRMAPRIRLYGPASPSGSACRRRPGPTGSHHHAGSFTSRASAGVQ